MDYIIRDVNGHVEVFDQSGQFIFSADNWQEALAELSEKPAA